MSKKRVEPEICAVPRWQMIKSTLNNLNFQEFVAAANSNANSVMIDVRTQPEHDLESINDSIVMDYLDKDLATKLEALEKDKTYYIYCRTGRRSLRVCVLLRNLGFPKVYNLEGGIVSRPT